jgi:UDP-N-acetylmuramate--alanine ligase
VAEASAIDLTHPRSLHVIGVGGTGMNAVASVLVGMGHHVTGSDIKSSAAVERVRAQGVTVFIGHDPANIGDVDAVVISTAVPERNIEVQEARRRGIPVLHRSEALGAIAHIRRTVAVAGTHGKTTTSSMLALVLREAGLQPSFVIGGDVNEIGTGAGWGEGDLFVVEADESDGSFLRLNTGAVVVTNVEPDHLEHYGGWPGLEAAFEEFVREAPGPRVLCADDERAAALAGTFGGVTYGTSAEADYRIVDVVGERASSHFAVVHQGQELARVTLPLAGIHNARNATAALVAGVLMGAPVEAAVTALGRFAGVARRFEFRGSAAGVTFIDDYAHLPTEVEAALAAANGGGWRRVVCAFQPHRYSRTATLWADFADAFGGANVLALTDVYAAGEAPRPGVSGELLVHAVLDAHPWKRVAYLPRRTDLAGYLAGELRPGDLCLTLGAGDITLLADEVQARLDGRPA